MSRASVRLDRLWKRRGLHKVKRISRTNGTLRESLYAKMDIRLDRMRYGLKDLIADTLAIRRGRNTAPDCPRLRWR
jgi:hypothetical protein